MRIPGQGFKIDFKMPVGEELSMQSAGVCLAWVLHCLSPGQELHYCAVPKPIVPIVPSRKMSKLLIHIHMPNQWTCQVNFFLQLGLQRFIRKQDHTWEQVGWEWLQPTLTERRVIHVTLVGFCYSVPASRLPRYGGSIYYCHIIRAFKCCKLVLCEYPEFLEYWHVTQIIFNHSVLAKKPWARCSG